MNFSQRWEKTLPQTSQKQKTIKDQQLCNSKADLREPIPSELKTQPQNIVILALKKLHLFAQHSSVTSIVQCQAARRGVTQHLKQLNSQQIRQAILVSIENDLLRFQNSSHMNLSFSSSTLKGHSEENEKDQLFFWHQYLEILIHNISTYLRKKWIHKAVYNSIEFKWNPTVFSLIHNQPHNHKTKLVSRQQYYENTSKKQNKLQNASVLQAWSHRRVLDLIKEVDKPQTANRLYLAFRFLQKSLKQKDNQLSSCLQSNDQLKTILSEQISLITSQGQQQKKYKTQLLLNQQQLDKLTERCKKLEKQLSRTLKTFEQAKEEESKKSYYVNPLFDKNKLEEKYMTEIIQLQSDLYMQKGQVKTLVDLFLDQTKITHHAFFDLGANSYFISKYDKALHKKIKYLKPFDGVNFDELLSLKEEAEDMTQCTRHMHRSTISIFSSIEVEGAIPSFVEQSFEAEEGP